MIKLTEEQVLSLHKIMINQTGGLDGLKDKNLLLSAIYSPFQTFGGVDMYPTIEEKAARLAFGIVKNHPFVDGNKRTGLLAMLVFLELNEIVLHFTQKELIALGLGLAEGSMDYSDTVEFIHKHK